MHQMISLMGCWIFKKSLLVFSVVLNYQHLKLTVSKQLKMDGWIVTFLLGLFSRAFCCLFQGDLAKKQHLGPTKHENEKWRTCQRQFFVTFLGW